jgi:hypothetical protein
MKPQLAAALVSPALAACRSAHAADGVRAALHVLFDIIAADTAGDGRGRIARLTWSPAEAH